MAERDACWKYIAAILSTEKVKGEPMSRKKEMCIVLATWLLATMAHAHHTYAMFDMTKAASIEGRIARLEWRNPHVFVWLYVPKPGKTGEYDLWAFENGPVSLLNRWAGPVTY